MALAAQRVGRLLDPSELARDAALPQATVHRHLNLLETGCPITRLPRAPLGQGERRSRPRSQRGQQIERGFAVAGWFIPLDANPAQLQSAALIGGSQRTRCSATLPVAIDSHPRISPLVLVLLQLVNAPSS